MAIGKISPDDVGIDVDKAVVERMMKDINTEDVYIRDLKSGKVYMSKSLYAKRLIAKGVARFIITHKEAKKLGIMNDQDKLKAYDDEHKITVINSI